MKRTDILTILARQDRIVYTLLMLSAALALAWVVWRHQFLAAQDAHKHAPARQAAR